jgi:hypothetical protein
MKLFAPKTLVLSLPAAVLLLATDPAFAFRCGSKLVRDGMHEQQVIAACGEPTSVYYRMPGVDHFATEVAITEFVYNFGPRKLMRRLIFEGNVLVEIETIGYGYIEK